MVFITTVITHLGCWKNTWLLSRRLDREIAEFLRLVSYSNASCRKTKGLDGM